ncbi:MAG TPA: DUF2064 domain-containing protein [Armatimonadota bacterium]|jgi:hypothetical protein
MDVLDKAATVPDAELVVAYKPLGLLPYFREAVPDAKRFLPTVGNTFAEELSNCFDELLEAGTAIVAVGTDHPTMPARTLELAFDAMASGEVEVVLGPSSEGGIYLVGMTRTHPEIFDGAFDLESVIERVAKAGAGWYLLPISRGINSPEDLAFLKADVLGEPANAISTPCTRRQVMSLTGAGVI